MGGRLYLGRGSLNLDGGRLTLDGGRVPPRSSYNFSTAYTSFIMLLAMGTSLIAHYVVSYIVPASVGHCLS